MRRGVGLYMRIEEHALAEACLNLAACYETGLGCEENLAVACNGTSARLPACLGQTRLAHYLFGAARAAATLLDHGGTRDVARAMSLWEEAAGQGDVEAMDRCGHHIEGTEVAGVPQDLAKVVRCGAAARSGHAAFQYTLGLLYLTGVHAPTVAHDEARGARWLRAAATQGHPTAAWVLDVSDARRHAGETGAAGGGRGAGAAQGARTRRHARRYCFYAWATGAAAAATMTATATATAATAVTAGRVVKLAVVGCGASRWALRRWRKRRWQRRQRRRGRRSRGTRAQGEREKKAAVLTEEARRGGASRSGRRRAGMLAEEQRGGKRTKRGKRDRGPGRGRGGRGGSSGAGARADGGDAARAYGARASRHAVRHLFRPCGRARAPRAAVRARAEPLAMCRLPACRRGLPSQRAAALRHLIA